MTHTESEPSPSTPDQRSARRRPRVRRGWVIALVGILVLPLAGALALKAFFPPERLREIAEPQLERRIARDVELGSVNLKVFPYIAIRLGDVRIANPPAGFSASPAVQLDALDLRLELLPLLRRDFQLSQVRLVRPLIRYEVAPDGTNNFTGMLASDSARTAEDPTRGSGSSFDIEDLVLVDGDLLYLNNPGRRALRFGVEAEFDVSPAEREGGPLASTGAFRLTEGLMVARGSDSTRLPDIDIGYRAVFDPGDGRVAVPEITVQAAGLNVTGQASSRVAEGIRSVRLDLSTDEFGIADLVAEMPAGTVSDTLEVDGRGRFELRWAGPLGGDPGPELTGTATYSNLSMRTPSRGQLLDGTGGTLTFSSDMLSMPDARGRLFGRPFEARLRVDDFADPMVDGHLAGQFGVAQLNDFRRGEPLPVSGDAAVAVDFRGPVGDLERWTVTGPVRLTGVTYSSETLPQPATIGDATIQLTGTGIRGDGIPVRIGTSQISLTFGSQQLLRYYLTEESARGAAPQIQFNAHANRLDVADLRKESPGVGYSDLLKARLSGKQVEGKAPEVIARERYHKPELSRYRASGNVSIGEWVNPPINASGVTFKVDLADGVIDITDVAGAVYGGLLSGDVRLDLGGAGPPFEMAYDLHIRGARAGALLERWTRLGRALSGTVDFDVDGQSPLDDAFLPVTAGFKANGTARFIEGRFEDFGLTQALSTYFNMASDRIRGFKDLGGPFEVRDGRFLVKDWAFQAGGLQGAVGGAAGLGGLLDLDLVMLLPASVLQNAPVLRNNTTVAGLLGQLTQQSADIPVRVGIGGTMTSPSLQVNAASLTSSLREKVEEAGRGRLEQEGRGVLERQKQDLLDRLRRGTRDTTANQDTAVAADSAGGGG